MIEGPIPDFTPGGRFSNNFMSNWVIICTHFKNQIAFIVMKNVSLTCGYLLDVERHQVSVNTHKLSRYLSIPIKLQDSSEGA